MMNQAAYNCISVSDYEQTLNPRVWTTSSMNLHLCKLESVFVFPLLVLNMFIPFSSWQPVSQILDCSAFLLLEDFIFWRFTNFDPIRPLSSLVKKIICTNLNSFSSHPWLSFDSLNWTILQKINKWKGVNDDGDSKRNIEIMKFNFVYIFSHIKWTLYLTDLEFRLGDFYNSSMVHLYILFLRYIAGNDHLTLR